MDEQIVQQIFDELLSSLEPLDTQNAALLQFLKAKGIATELDVVLYYRNVRTQYYQAATGGTGHAPDVEVVRVAVGQ